MPDNKWKTFPCKECILKSKCTKSCFDFPDEQRVRRYVIDNSLGNICLSCKTKLRGGKKLSLIYHCTHCVLNKWPGESTVGCQL